MNEGEEERRKGPENWRKNVDNKTSSTKHQQMQMVSSQFFVPICLVLHVCLII